MKKNRLENFDEKNLPKNRWEVFKDLFIHRFGFLMKISLLISVFFIPLFLWNMYFNEIVREALINIKEENILETYTKCISLINTKNLVNVLFILIATIGITGGIHVIQGMAWEKLVFTSDFFDGIKLNFKKNILFSILLSLSWFLFEFMIYYVPIKSYSSFVNMLLYGIAIIQILFILSIYIFSLTQNDIYELRVIELLKNSFSFTIQSIIPLLGFIVICFAIPVVIAILNNLMLDILNCFLISFFIGFVILVFILYTNRQFDKYINKINYPNMYDKGIHRKK